MAGVVSISTDSLLGVTQAGLRKQSERGVLRRTRNTRMPGRDEAWAMPTHRPHPAPTGERGWGKHTHLRVFSFLSRDLACCSLMMVAFTCGGFMCTFSFPPTSRRTVAANLVWVFRT